jgi:iron(III) transport system substrate-binding protein
MKKIILLLSVLLAFGGLAFGSGNGGSKELTLYYSHPADWTDPLIKEFQERTGIHVNLVGAGTGELASRIKAEKAAPQADVLWGGGAATYVNIIDLLAPYKHAYMDKVPASSRDPQNRWHASQTFNMVIIYNPKLVAPEDVPKGWADLLNPKFKGKIAHADPAKSSSALAALNIQLKVMGGDNEKGWGYMKKFVENLDGKVLGSSSATFKGVSDGEYAVGITYEQAALKYMRAGADLKVVYPIEGTVNFPGPIALVKGGPNPENAKKFIDFVMSEDAQAPLGELNMRAIRTDIQLPDFMVPNDSPLFVPFSQDLLENTNAKKTKWKNLIVGRY